MTVKKSFLIILRFTFILFTLFFLKGAFYKWDGFSYYISFADLLPELSLVFVLWSLISLIFAVLIWLPVIILYSLISRVSSRGSLEQILFFLLIITLPVYIRNSFFGNFSITGFFGLDRNVLLAAALILASTLFLFAGRHAEKVLSYINSKATPLVWIFLILLFFASAVSAILPITPAETDYLESKGLAVAEGEEGRPNIILVVIDTLTAVDMQLYGYDRPTTPFLSEWSKDAAVFNKAYSSSNWTSPATMSLMTGQRPWTHKVWYRASSSLSDQYYENNIAGLLRESGYDVLAFVQNRAAHPESLGIAEPFQKKDLAHTFHLQNNWWLDKISFFLSDRPIVREWIFSVNPIASRINRLRPDVSTTLMPPEKVYNSFLEYVSEERHSDGREGRRPYFAWLQVFPPHDPYLPASPSKGVYGDADKMDTFKEQTESGLFYVEYDKSRQGDADILRKRYDEFIHYSDMQFKTFLSRLDRAVDMSNTVIILTSDHGEMFEHGYLGHDGPHMYEPLVHVPLVIKMPERMQGVAQRVDMPVELIDVAPTILEFAGVKAPDWIEGRSLIPMLHGFEEEQREVISMQLIKNRSFGSRISKGTFAVWDSDYKFIYNLEEGIRMLFDLSSDKDEVKNIVDSLPEVADRFEGLILDKLDAANSGIRH